MINILPLPINSCVIHKLIWFLHTFLPPSSLGSRGQFIWPGSILCWGIGAYAGQLSQSSSPHCSINFLSIRHFLRETWAQFCIGKWGERFANFKRGDTKISVSRHFLPNVSRIMLHLNWAYQKKLKLGSKSGGAKLCFVPPPLFVHELNFFDRSNLVAV